MCIRDSSYRTKRLLFTGRTSDTLETRDTWPQEAIDRLLMVLRETDTP